MKDLELITKCKKGDRKAHEFLYSKYSNSLFRLASRYIKSEADAEDVTMTAFIKIFNSIGKFNFQGDGSLEAWMRKVFVNEALMWLRSRHNFNMIESLDETLPDFDLKELAEWEAEDIYKLISNLPTGYRTVFNLFVVEGYSHQEIAAMLSITENTSRSQLFKAKASLKKVLLQEGFQYGT